MSVDGTAFTAKDYPSPARLNKKTNFVGTGTELAALSTTYAGQLASVTVSGGGYIGGIVYKRSTDNTTWEGLSTSKHYHDADSETGGGLLANVFIENIGQFYFLNMLHASVGKAAVVKASGASATDVVDATNSRIDLNTGTVSGDYVNVQNGGIKLSFTGNAVWQARVRFNANTMFAARMGVHTENIQDSTVVDRKFGIEACDSASVAKNWQIVTANATTRSVFDTTEDCNQAQDRSYKLEFTTATDVKFTVEGTTIFTTTSSIPTTFRTGQARIANFGIKTNNTTGKILRVCGYAVYGQLSDDHWMV